jgi:hypothetical protein
MKSILLNGRNEKRLIKMEEEKMQGNDDEDDGQECQALMNDSIEDEDDDFHLVMKNISSSNKLKYVDDCDTDSIKSLINLINKTNNLKVESLHHKIRVENCETNELTFKENCKSNLILE